MYSYVSLPTKIDDFPSFFVYLPEGFSEPHPDQQPQATPSASQILMKPSRLPDTNSRWSWGHQNKFRDPQARMVTFVDIMEVYFMVYFI